MNERTPVRLPIRLWAGVVALLLIAPTLVVVPLSFTDRQSFRFPIEGWSWQWYQRFFSEPRWIGALTTSLRVALITAVVATIVGTLAVVALDRGRPRLGAGVRAFLLPPILVPGIVVAVAILGSFLRWGISGTFRGLVLAHLVLSIPFVMIPVSTAMRAIDPTFERAASVLGATPLRRFLQVQLPLLAPGVATGFVFAFVTSLDEVVIAFFLQSPTLRTLPVQMYNSVTVETDPTIAVASTMMLAVSTIVILLPSMVAVHREKRKHAAAEEVS